MGTLGQFAQIASNFNSSRSVINGYNASAAFIMLSLAQTNFVVTTQDFDILLYSQLANATLQLIMPSVVTFRLNSDYSNVRFGGSGTFDFTAGTSPLITSGCSATDYSVLQPGQIALISSSTATCTLYTKGLLAQSANASGILFYASTLNGALASPRLRSANMLLNDTLITIPVLSITNPLAQLFAEVGSQVRIATTNSIYTVNTFNVFAESVGGDPANTMMFGAHLDSVPAGPGINDDGSGSATLLEIATQFDLIVNNQNKVRFAWWGAEEEGLLGSRYYVYSLAPEDRASLVLYLNFDMLASPNYILMIGNGATSPDPMATNGSIILQKAYEEYYQSMNITYGFAALGGGSDYYPFAQAGIPVGTLQAGAGEIKSDASRLLYGGLANAALDPCYHQPCDNLQNINQQCLKDISKGAAALIERLATMSDPWEWLASS